MIAPSPRQLKEEGLRVIIEMIGIEVEDMITIAEKKTKGEYMKIVGGDILVIGVEGFMTIIDGRSVMIREIIVENEVEAEIGLTMHAVKRKS